MPAGKPARTGVQSAVNRSGPIDAVYLTRSQLLLLGVSSLALLGVPASHSLKTNKASRVALELIHRKLADAQRRTDESEVNRLAHEAIAALGGQAGVPAVPDEYRVPPADVRPLTASEAHGGFYRLLASVRSRKWWRKGLDPACTEHLPREAASVIRACLEGVRAGARDGVALLSEAREAGDYLLWTQEQGGRGLVPFPASRAGHSTAFWAAERFLRRAQRSGRLDEVVHNGWIVDDVGDGGLQFDNGLAGVALLELYEATGDGRYLRGAEAAAEWAAGRPAVPNWNYNAFSMDLLARVYRVTGEEELLAIAKQKFRLGILPGQLTKGDRVGRWGDPHNARPAYHYILVRGIASLLSALPEGDPDRPVVVRCLRQALLARNREFITGGVMNVEPAMETLTLVARLPRSIQQELGPCQTEEALAVLEQFVTAELRANRRGAPDVEARLFERAIARTDG